MLKYYHIFTLPTGESSSKEITSKLSNIDLGKDSQQVAIKDFGDVQKILNSAVYPMGERPVGITLQLSNL
ncbi:MAG: hypothetical protein CML56_02830 [Rhodobacteraceae bacterium]|nr:hypothetical protein [Paracoccaceae bacterium]|tara:strand:+ start:1163 stop:1372 length:210 start_codon:yes stop_codon:yes gene_type:complete